MYKSLQIAVTLKPALKSNVIFQVNKPATFSCRNASNWTKATQWINNNTIVGSLNRNYSPPPQILKLNPDATEVREIVKHYEESHMPLGFQRRPYGPPYTDTSKLEQLPPSCYVGHKEPSNIRDKFAYSLVRFFRVFTHMFFREKYGHHAVTLETVAAVPGMVAGMLHHFRALRKMRADRDWIAPLLEEAENERMHLMVWMKVVKPTLLERIIVVLAQIIYTPAYAALYIFSPYTAHRFVGYLEEEACDAYSAFLGAIDRGAIANVNAPEIAKKYWNLPPDAKLRDVVLVVRADEAMHRNVNHIFSNQANEKIPVVKSEQLSGGL